MVKRYRIITEPVNTHAHRHSEHYGMRSVTVDGKYAQTAKDAIIFARSRNMVRNDENVVNVAFDIA